MLLVGTNNLASHNANPELLINTLDDQITELKGFNNLGHIFLCKIKQRFDSHVVNSKVVRFNKLLHECFSDTEKFLTVVDTIPPISSNSIMKMAYILVMSGYPNLVAYCCIVCIEFLLLPILPDINALELVVDAGNVKMAPVHLRLLEFTYYKFLIELFDILAISEHCLFQEQFGMLKLSCDNT